MGAASAAEQRQGNYGEGVQTHRGTSIWRGGAPGLGSDAEASDDGCGFRKLDIESLTRVESGAVDAEAIGYKALRGGGPLGNLNDIPSGAFMEPPPQAHRSGSFFGCAEMAAGQLPWWRTQGESGSGIGLTVIDVPRGPCQISMGWRHPGRGD